MRIRWTAIVALMLALGRFPALAVEDYSLWAHSAKLHFNTSATGANVPKNIINFALPVRITDSRIISQSMATGADVRFADQTGAHLEFQIERWAPDQGKAEFWVRVPKLDSLSDKGFLTVYWGKAGADWLSDGNKVFDKNIVGYAEVYHLGEGGTQTRMNSAANNNHAAPKNYDGDERVGGVIGMADSLDGNPSGPDYLDLGAGFSDLTTFTFNIWVYPTHVGSWERLIDLGNGEYSDNMFFTRSRISDTLNFRAFGTPGQEGPFGQTQNQDFGGLDAPKALDLKKWNFLGVVVSGQTATMFKNGIRIASGQLAGSLNKIVRTQNYLGRSNWAVDAPFSGIFDEAQMATVAHSAEWMKLSYESQRPEATMFTWEFAPEQKLAITVQPAGAMVDEGKPVKLSVVAIAAKSISYQWFKDDVPISGAVGASYTITAVTLNDMGIYTCRLSDGVDNLVTGKAAISVPELLSTWAHSQRIFFNTTPGAANVPGEVSVIPILLRLGKSNLDFSQVGEGGKDLRFASSDGTMLAYAVESWGVDTAEVWVRATKVPGGSDKGYFIMYWGKAAAPSGSAPGYVFSLNDNWRAYYGFNETNASGLVNPQDATLNGYQATGVSETSVAAGVIGKAFHFSGNAHVEAPQAATEGLKTFTVIAWAREAVTGHGTVNIAVDNPHVFGTRLVTGGQGEFGAYSLDGHIGAWNGIHATPPYFHQETETHLNEGGWHQLAITYTGASFALYVDGTAAFSLVGDNIPLAPNVLGIGGLRSLGGAWSGLFNGDIDAVQVTGDAKSADWIRLAYATQSPGSNLLSFGAPADLPPPAPTIDPPGGEFEAAVQVQLACAADSARILYTLDGSEPDTIPHGSTRNIGSNLRLTASGTVKAIAYRNGKASAISSATFKVTPVPTVFSSGDTLKPGASKEIEAGTRVIYPNQDSKAPVRLNLGETWNPKPAGFDRVGPLFILTAVDTAAAFPGLQLVGDSLQGLSLYRRDPNAVILWMSPKDGALWIPGAGSYFYARDIQPPRIRMAGTDALGPDSLRVRIVIEDNVSMLKGKIRFASESRDSLSWWSTAAGEELRFDIAVPADPESPLEASFSATDQSLFTRYPEQGYLTLPRPIPALSAPFNLKPGIKWRMAGMPMRADAELTLTDLAAMSGTGPLYAAIWRSPPALDSGYLLLKGKAALPPGKGFWIASEKGAPSLNFPASRAYASDSDGLFTIKLERGWNLITCPGFKAMAWPVSVSDGEAYLRSPLKPLHAFVDSAYTRPDSLRPWEAYYAYYDKDTLVRVGPGAPRVTDKAAAPSPKTSSQTAFGAAASPAPAPKTIFGAAMTHGLDLGLTSPSGIALRLGASGFAVLGLGVEDEGQPPAMESGASAWLSRSGRALGVDYVAWDTLQAMAWTIAAHAQPAGAGFAVTNAALPEGYEAWAVSPARRLKWRLEAGGNIPVTGDDTLRVYAGTPAALAKLADLRNGREASGAFAARLVTAGRGLQLLLDLPSAARIDVDLWSARGASLGGFSGRAFSAGRHVVGGADLSRSGGALPQGMYWMQLKVQGPGWNARRVQSLGLVR